LGSEQLEINGLNLGKIDVILPYQLNPESFKDLVKQAPAGLGLDVKGYSSYRSLQP
jgi:hypothetical protein